MKTKIQIKSVFGSIIFEYESEDNTIKKTLEEALKQNADLRYADLRYADLRNADLRYADLRYAVLRYADLNKIKHLFQIIPETGSFIAWKKGQNDCLIKLEIPAKAKRVNSLGGRKCRAEYVKTLEIWDGKKKIKKCSGTYDGKTVYKVGELTHPDSFDSSPLVECSNGIHFFITKQEAKDW